MAPKVHFQLPYNQNCWSSFDTSSVSHSDDAITLDGKILLYDPLSSYFGHTAWAAESGRWSCFISLPPMGCDQVNGLQGAVRDQPTGQTAWTRVMPGPLLLHLFCSLGPLTDTPCFHMGVSPARCGADHAAIPAKDSRWTFPCSSLLIAHRHIRHPCFFCFIPMLWYAWL